MAVVTELSRATQWWLLYSKRQQASTTAPTISGISESRARHLLRLHLSPDHHVLAHKLNIFELVTVSTRDRKGAFSLQLLNLTLIRSSALTSGNRGDCGGTFDRW